MKKQTTIAFLLLITLALSAVAPFAAAATLSKPQVTLTANWELTDETAYPDSFSEHDPDGAGMVQYQNTINYDGIMIYYENAQSSYTNAQLKSEIEEIFERDHEITYEESGTMTVAGVTAGYAKAYDSEYDSIILELVFIKGSYYINAYAYYYDTTDSQNDVMSILNSIGGNVTPSPTQAPTNDLFSGTNLLIIVGVIVAVVIVIVIVVIMLTRKKSAPQTNPQDYISPPPPTQ